MPGWRGWKGTHAASRFLVPRKMARIGRVKRVTKETSIDVTVALDGATGGTVRSPVAFLNHMLGLLSAHGGFRLDVRARGDVEVDDHHLVEDLGISLGQAFSKALGNRSGIRRYGLAVVPMDEALVQVALDLSGRAHLSYGLNPGARKIKDFDVALVEEFLLGLVRSVPCTLHVTQAAGRNPHHVVEAAFKALGRALGQAAERDLVFRGIPSTKGIL